ncbi:LysR family transcriptional regulator [Pseudooceanicola sp. CBS1P-1]|uniref:LysR family transcriptional regulator n=1 Tax=Pseudooceanicola albus TaxID=2692189 RepID=A0A6L7G7F0_9RHOB|nr:MULTISPECIES: LysR family transcriptional regulator [Pseudooceanicola]MBT9385779.1 LysR family transcriptional regulator [Pseudooceanicola endophyticus]MXN20011.1 LysR family transcriptional regulator [Pseudooceanicola albus]
MTHQADRFREMEVFVAILEEGSFSAAALRLGMTPSGVSRTLDRCERRLGLRLMTRSTRSLTLTEEGHLFAAMSRRLLAELDRAEAEITADGPPSGLLRISAAVSHGRLKIVPLLQEFAHRHPRLRIDLTLTDLLEDPAQGGTDVAIRFGRLADSRLRARKLGEEPMVVVAAPAYLAAQGTPRHPEELRNHDCLLFSFDPGRARWPFRVAGARQEVQVGGRFRANSGEALGMLAVSGLGIARVARFAVEEDIRAGRLHEILAQFPGADAHPVHALFVGADPVPARIRALVDFLAERMG